MTTTDIQQMLRLRSGMEQVYDNCLASFETINRLMQVALDESDKINWRAAWLLEKLDLKRPRFIEQLLPRIDDALIGLDNYSKQRHFLKIILNHPVSSDRAGKLYVRAINLLQNPEIPVAVRVHAMQLAYEISEHEKDLKPELALLIEHELEFHPTAGIISRGKKIISRLNQELHPGQPKKNQKKS